MAEIRPRPGQTIGHYTLVSPMPGRMEGRYRGASLDTGEAVVIILLPPLTGAGERYFDTQASNLIRLRHPSIAGLLAYGSENGMPYLVQEFVEGQSLQGILDAGERLPLSPLSVLRQVAVAMDFAHAAGVVHGDLQPDAIVLEGDAHTIVTDFGLTTLGKAASAGSPSYRAPEQARSSEASAAADRYSFAVLAALLLQKAPTDRASVDQLDRVLVRGLASDPSGRWPSCTEMVEALTGAMQPATPVVTRRSRRGLWIAIATVALVSAFALLLVLTRPPPSEPAPASAAPAAMTLSRSTALPGSSVVVNAANLPAHQQGIVEFESQPRQLAVFTADQSGSATVTIVVPQDVTSGDHTVALCWDGACPLKQGLSVVNPTPSPGPTPSQVPSSAPSPSTTSSSTATPGAAASP